MTMKKYENVPLFEDFNLLYLFFNSQEHLFF